MPFIIQFQKLVLIPEENNNNKKKWVKTQKQGQKPAIIEFVVYLKETEN